MSQGAWNLFQAAQVTTEKNKMSNYVFRLKEADALRKMPCGPCGILLNNSTAAVAYQLKVAETQLHETSRDIQLSAHFEELARFP